jgi:predicted Fe-Mo cluster-binding NifX family protein
VKIAIITDDGNTVSQHFGRALFYQVVTIEQGSIFNREMREKIGHDHFSTTETGQQNHEHAHVGHGQDHGSHLKHAQMAETVSDCQAMICGGMGRGAYESMKLLNVQPILTNLTNVEEVIKAYIDGKLVDHTELLH